MSMSRNFGTKGTALAIGSSVLALAFTALLVSSLATAEPSAAPAAAKPAPAAPAGESGTEPEAVPDGSAGAGIPLPRRNPLR